MKDFSWSYFWRTGDIDAYMLYKEIADGDGGTQTELETIEEAVPAEAMEGGG